MGWGVIWALRVNLMAIRPLFTGRLVVFHHCPLVSLKAGTDVTWGSMAKCRIWAAGCPAVSVCVCVEGDVLQGGGDGVQAGGWQQ